MHLCLNMALKLKTANRSQHRGPAIPVAVCNREPNNDHVRHMVKNAPRATVAEAVKCLSSLVAI